ncbi:hypothetical protein BH10PSE2_BH10PSE2_18280 [soil metagenome]
MEPLSRPQAIIEFCLAPLNLEPGAEGLGEVKRRMEHVIKTFQAKAAKPVAIDFSSMPSQVINEVAHGNE